MADPASPDAAGPEKSAFVDLDAPASSALDTLLDAYATLWVTTPYALASHLPVDLIAGGYREPRRLLDATASLARGVVARAIGAEDAPDDAALDAARAAVDRERAALDEEPEPLLPEIRDEEALPVVGELLREVGLETFNASVLLATGRDDGRRCVVWNRVPPETALIWLQGRLFDRIEAVMLGEDLLELEQRAARWTFDRWSPPLGLRDAQAEAFTREVREREWRLVDRDTLAFGQPALHAFCEGPDFRRVPAKQRRLARAMRASFTGVFNVSARTGDEVEFTAPLDGRRYRVHEHNRDFVYSPGFLAVGRLIPLGGGRWLRSPGMVIFKAAADDAAQRYAEAIAGIRNLAPALRVEALLASVMGRKRVPREVPAAKSRGEAEALLRKAREVLEAHGRVEEVAPKEAPADLRARAEEDSRFFTYEIDDDVAGWIGALTEVARRGRGRGGRRGGRPAPFR